MADCDVAVIGGGPAGYAAALKAAELGASVTLIEAEKVGGACVHHACIPTDIMLDAALRFLDDRELAVMGAFSLGEQFNLARAAARKDALVRKVAEGIAAALRMRKVRVVSGRASFTSPSAVAISLQDGGTDSLSAEAFVIATGSRWEPPQLPGVPGERILTADAVQELAAAPASALVLCDGPGQTAFGVEYAVLLAVAGSEVTIAARRPVLLPGLDAALAPAVEGMLSNLGIRVFAGVDIEGGASAEVTLTSVDGRTPVAAEIVVAGDTRRPFFTSLDLGRAGVSATDCIPVDRSCRTNVPGVFAAGDVTGGAMLSSVATHMGEVAGTNAAGGQAAVRVRTVPHVLHAFPEIAWIGLTEEMARQKGGSVRAGVADLSFNARAISLGAREGVVKVVAEPELGEVLGVHAVGPGAAEVIALAATVMQAEVPLADLASMVYWHPTIGEGLVEAARRALA
jgi:dihydrolipoamide dehydrogenase